MASVCKIIRGYLYKKRINNLKYLSNNVSGKQFANKHSYPIVYIIGGVVTFYTAYKCRNSLCIQKIQAKSVSYLTN